MLVQNNNCRTYGNLNQEILKINKFQLIVAIRIILNKNYKFEKF